MVRCRDVVKVSGGGLAGMLGCWAAGLLGWAGEVELTRQSGGWVKQGQGAVLLCCFAACIICTIWKCLGGLDPAEIQQEDDPAGRTGRTGRAGRAEMMDGWMNESRKNKWNKSK